MCFYIISTYNLHSKYIFFINLLLSYILVFWTYFLYMYGTIGDQWSSASFKPVEIYALVDPRVGCQAGLDHLLSSTEFSKMTSKLAKFNLWIAPLKYEDNEDVLLDLHPFLNSWIRTCDVQIIDVEWNHNIIDIPTVIQMIVVMLIFLSEIFIQSSRSIILVLQYKQNRM